jgi:DNA-binding response OmpR family regulator
VGETSGPLDGEDIATSHWEDARHWMSIYGDLIEFKRGILDRIRVDLSKLPPAAQKAAQADLQFIESQMHGYQRRLELWQRRLPELNGLYVDPEERRIKYRKQEATLTHREFQLFKFLLDHPHRYFTVVQILEQAWAEPNLFPEQVRTYVLRLRKVFVEMQLPCDIVNRPGRGYSLEFSAERQQP